MSKAEQLAVELCIQHQPDFYKVCEEAGMLLVSQEAELRRLDRVNAQLLEALQKIAAIKDEMYGSDWAEITQARDIANAAIDAAKEQS